MVNNSHASLCSPVGREPGGLRRPPRRRRRLRDIRHALPERQPERHARQPDRPNPEGVAPELGPALLRAPRRRLPARVGGRLPGRVHARGVQAGAGLLLVAHPERAPAGRRDDDGRQRGAVQRHERARPEGDVQGGRGEGGAAEGEGEGPPE
ncbi:unnamed protein product [Sphagnum tenellum]